MIHSSKNTKDIGPADPSQHIKFHIVGNTRNSDWLKKTLEEVSDPDNPRYGKHLTKEEINAQTAPSSADFDTICGYLASFGLVYLRRDSDVEVEATVEQIEKMFNTKLHKFINPNDNDSATKYFEVRHTTQITIPAEIKSVVSIVSGF
eukprot:TRINITY_DN1263_c0_g1_i2.p1 TRINITY_DN1263_c0_g1~~TRINITY_DN1263_c0_g1_i2.p1  ORF type:complete len:148 (-),score=22.53 TRINITY_DN1263_c0_g1_i2:229-672(-)